jgi:hypothetical protein
VWKHCSKKKSCGEILYQSTMFFFKKKTIKLNYQPAQYEKKKKKLKLTKTILNKKKNHMEKHCSNQQCFKEKTTKLNFQPAQY